MRHRKSAPHGVLRCLEFIILPSLWWVVSPVAVTNSEKYNRSGGTHESPVMWGRADFGRPGARDLQVSDFFAPIRINAGGPRVALNSGIWQGDTYFSGGVTHTIKNEREISNTNDDVLFRTERICEVCSYNVPVLPNRRYTVTLYFAEIFETVPDGGRVFIVNIENEQVLFDYEIIKTAPGKFRAHKESTTVDVEDDSLTIDFIKKTGGAFSAKISAIEVEEAFFPPLGTTTQEPSVPKQLSLTSNPTSSGPTSSPSMSPTMTLTGKPSIKPTMPPTSRQNDEVAPFPSGSLAINSPTQLPTKFPFLSPTRVPTVLSIQEVPSVGSSPRKETGRPSQMQQPVMVPSLAGSYLTTYEPTSAEMRTTTVQYQFAIQNSADQSAQLLADVSNNVKKTLLLLMAKEGTDLYELAASSNAAIDTVSSVLLQAEDSGGSVLTSTLATDVVVLHLKSASSETVRFVFLQYWHDLEKNIMYPSTYTGTKILSSAVIIRLQGVPSEEMQDDDVDVFEKVVLNFLGDKMASAGIDVTAVEVLSQLLVRNDAGRLLSEELSDQNLSHSQKVIRTGRRKLQESSTKTASLEVSTRVTGEHKSPSGPNLEKLVEDSINTDGGDLAHDLKSSEESDYFDEVTGVSARPGKDTAIEGADTTNESTGQSTEAGMKGYVDRSTEKRKRGLPWILAGSICFALLCCLLCMWKKHKNFVLSVLLKRNTDLGNSVKEP